MKFSKPIVLSFVVSTMDEYGRPLGWSARRWFKWGNSLPVPRENLRNSFAEKAITEDRRYLEPPRWSSTRNCFELHCGNRQEVRIGYHLVLDEPLTDKADHLYWHITAIQLDNLNDQN